VEIRALSDTDIEPVVELWQRAGLTRPWNDPRKDIERARAVYPELVLVAADADAVIGSVIAGYDGHRGWLYYLATAAVRASGAHWLQRWNCGSCGSGARRCNSWCVRQMPTFWGSTIRWGTNDPTSSSAASG